MLIDFHTHVFPAALAEKAIAHMTQQMADNYESFHIFFNARADGTVEGLLRTMEESGCTHSVLCPVVTSPKSAGHTNAFSMAQKSEKLIPFAGLLPNQEGWEAALEDIAAQGFQGIKLHPEFQNFDVDSPRSVEVVKRAENLGLIVLLHAGRDPGYAPPAHCTPRRMVNLLEKVDGGKIVAAHMGGWKEWEEVERCLSDSPIYFDTSCCAGFIDPDYCRHLMRRHGTDKILFGSDYPWLTSGDTLEFVSSLGLTEGELAQICWQNAAKLLKLP